MFSQHFQSQFVFFTMTRIAKSLEQIEKTILILEEESYIKFLQGKRFENYRIF